MNYTKIILSGRRNTGKTTLLWSLQKQLNWPIFSVSQYIRDYIRINGLQGASSEVMADHDRLMGEEIAQRVVGLLHTDYPVIIESRMFEYIRQEWTGTLKVLLEANDQVRINRNAHREGITPEKSAQRLIKKEEKWIQKMEAQFNFPDFFNKDYYDLVIDTSDLTQDQVTQKILDTLSGRV